MTTDRLELIKMMSDGSFGSREKWLAFDRKISRKVVLEKLKKRCDSSHEACNIHKEDFREAVLQRCSRRHPGIHLCNGLVKDGLTNVYISFECHEGLPLKRWLDATQRQGNVLSFELVRIVILQLADAIEHLHLLQVVHCAIIPANVYLYFGKENISPSQLSSMALSSSSLTIKNVRVKLANFKEASTAGDPIRFLKNDSMIPTDGFNDILPPFVHKLWSKTRGQPCLNSVDSKSKFLMSHAAHGTIDTTSSGQPWSRFNPLISGCRHNNIFLEDTIQPSFDIWCLGAMIFLCITGNRHWNASCGCCKGRNSLYASIRRIKSRKYRSSSFSAKKRVPKFKVKSGSWSTLTPECHKMLASMVSPLPHDRPSINEVLRSSLFLSETKWRKH